MCNNIFIAYKWFLKFKIYLNNNIVLLIYIIYLIKNIIIYHEWFLKLNIYILYLVNNIVLLLYYNFIKKYYNLSLKNFEI